MRRRITCVALLILLGCTVRLVALQPETKPSPHLASEPSATPARPATDLFLARSLGGSRFAAGDRVFVPDASSPELVRLPKGGLLALFDKRMSADGHTTLFATRSKDEGRTWTRARPIRITGRTRSPKDSRGHRGSARHADVLRMPNSTLRIYYIDDAGNGDCVVRCATSVDGLNYKNDDAVEVVLEKWGDARPGILRAGRQYHLFVSRIEAREPSTPAAKSTFEIVHFTSRDARKFERVGRVDLRGGVPGAGFSAHARGIRAIITLDNQLRSVISRDGDKWTLEPDVLLPTGQNATVVETRDGTYLMAYEKSRGPGLSNVKPEALVSLAPRIKTPRAADVPAGTEGGVLQTPDDSDTHEQVDLNHADADASDDASAGMDEGWEAFAETARVNETTETEDSTEPGDPVDDLGNPAETADAVARSEVAESTESNQAAAEDEHARAEAERLAQEREEWLAVPDPVRPPNDVLPPLPDFTTPVNYAEWYARLCDQNTPDNAYWAYSEFMPSPLDLNRQQNEWPALEIMYNRTDFTEPAPWDPAKLPEWEASYQASKALLEKFEAASRHTGFGRPIQFRQADFDESPTGQPLLVGLLLPDLSAHRSLVKQTLGANWRIDESGKPSADKMMEGWRTALSSANHMHQGATLIEQLVGTAEQSLVQSDARQALRQGVLKGKQLEEALALLEHYDHDDFDVNRSIQGEHAMVLDLMQAMFKSDKPGDPPKPSPEAIEKVLPLFGEDSKMIPEIKAMKPADVKKTLNAFETYYAEAKQAMATGYPQVRTSDMDKMAERHIEVSPLTKTLLPAFGRVQKIRARSEASRRATQLSYAVHIYKEQNGHWPQSLNELPDRFSQTMRTDPFTGGQFGYRVDENGPVIYSLSENGIDDGGRHSARWDDEKNGDSDDHVFWPVQPK